VDFYRASRESADVANIFQIVGEYDHCKRAGHGIFTEIKEVHAFGAGFNADDFTRNALGFADVLAGLVDGNAVGSAGRGDCKEEE
jgi:hypothetical protein